ncbi:hypothetical protein Pmani_029521 [Petrolisthes manimaculis]|uniref:PiggyBac transposable element-derived protein domain-containing protein n=1 Tax=Petrolisthes manimaculis TaxID=1843537 RepID=A0AAE1NXU9_9EUCA|nr:hypothetical protein Pmani_029521 [Petrolisthes manimaculis]
MHTSLQGLPGLQGSLGPQLQGPQGQYYPQHHFTTAQRQVINTELSFLELFFTRELLKYIAIETNIHAEQINKSDSWVMCNEVDMAKFLGLSFFMGILKFPTLRHYWNTDRLYSHSLFPNTMSGKRFREILRNFRCFNGRAVPERSRDCLIEVRPVMAYLGERFRSSYTPDEHLLLDERGVKWQGRLSFKPYTSDSNAPSSEFQKHALKIFTLAESATGYIYGFDMYSGQYKTTQSAVSELLEPLYNRGYKIYADISEFSVGLCEHLYSLGVCVCGLLRDTPRELAEQQNMSRMGVEQHNTGKTECRTYIEQQNAPRELVEQQNTSRTGYRTQTEQDFANRTGIEHQNMSGMDYRTQTGLQNSNKTQVDLLDVSKTGHRAQIEHRGTHRTEMDRLEIEEDRTPQDGAITTHYKGPVLMLTWRDNEVVNMASTFHTGAAILKHQRAKVKAKDGGYRNTTKQVRKPLMLDDYERHTSGSTDYFDQLMQHYDHRRTQTWTKKVAFFFFKMALHNAFVLYGKYTRDERKLSLLQYTENIITKLIDFQPEDWPLSGHTLQHASDLPSDCPSHQHGPDFHSDYTSCQHTASDFPSDCTECPSYQAVSSNALNIQQANASKSLSASVSPSEGPTALASADSLLSSNAFLSSALFMHAASLVRASSLTNIPADHAQPGPSGEHRILNKQSSSSGQNESMPQNLLGASREHESITHKLSGPSGEHEMLNKRPGQSGDNEPLLSATKRRPIKKKRYIDAGRREHPSHLLEPPSKYFKEDDETATGDLSY